MAAVHYLSAQILLFIFLSIILSINPTNIFSEKRMYRKRVGSNREMEAIFVIPDSFRVEWWQFEPSTMFLSKVRGRNAHVVQFPQKFWYILEGVGRERVKQRWEKYFDPLFFHVMLISVLSDMQKHSESSKYLLSEFHLNPFAPNVLLKWQHHSRGPKCTHPWRST